MKILYYDCFSGISGDMNLGAMLDLGVDKDYLLEGLERLGIGGYELSVTKDERKGITGTKVDVIVKNEKSGHRNLRDIEAIIRGSGLSDRVKETSLDIFMQVARAEAKVHGKDLYDIHFHEVGATDSIIDIAGAALCLEFLNADRVMASPVEVGSGFVTCEHGTFPVPAPATVEILKGIPIKSGIVPFETTTPTGAAILASTVNEFTERIRFRLLEVGYGIGGRDTEIPNVLRVLLGETDEATEDDCDREEAVIIESNIDDMNPEMFDFFIDALLKAGAHDVFLTPVIMKKSRPATTLSVLCSNEDENAIQELLLTQTSTFGTRKYVVGKTMLKRDFSEVTTKYGTVRVKNAYFRGKKMKSKPEYEDCRKLADQHGVSILEIYESIK
ncbi:MAG: nickel pincer cofactor biosynthesis protein LarC [Deltaproteobacteria bacterium]|nr:nickel pincer cofactor biosynthesis protein LarC [Deltaproteobacteria bacterium]MBN2846176.1 nickel pincer cofactor biosynthesis protein LarC [Deltaproteobacteria bacterium]